MSAATWADPTYDPISQTVAADPCDHPAMTGTDEPDVWACDSCGALIRDVPDPDGDCRSYGRDGVRRYRQEVVKAGEALRVSIWDVEDRIVAPCPACGVGELSSWIGGEGPDLAICLNRLCDFVATRAPLPADRSASRPGAAGGEGER